MYIYTIWIEHSLHDDEYIICRVDCNGRYLDIERDVYTKKS